MKKLIYFIIYMLPLIVNAQIATEANIPFALNTDGDALPNIIDPDDDNDGVLDNLDAFPLDNTKSTPDISTTTITTIADAPCIGNGTNNPHRNFGISATAETHPTNVRYFLMKFTMPTINNIVNATLTLHSNTENDPLSIYLQPSSNWIEGNFAGGTGSNVNDDGSQGVTYTSNTTAFNNKILLGTTVVPSGTTGNYVYTFSIPLAQLPASGDFTFIIANDDPNSTLELLYTKESSGKAATIDFNYNAPITPRLIVTQPTNDTTYIAGSPYTVGFALSQAPTSTVYIPIELSDAAKATILGDKVLVFDATNWNIVQTKTITPIAPGAFNIIIKPLHSSDVFYNGFNNNDLLNYYNQASNITNLTGWTVTTGTTFTHTLMTTSAVGSASHLFKIIIGPTGMSVVENNGKINFTPLSFQVGTWPITIELTDSFGNKSYYNTSIIVTSSGATDPTGIYVVPNGAVGGNGTAALPFNDLVTAVNAAAGGGNVYIRGGEYDFSTPMLINTVGTATTPIVIKPAPGESVKLNFNSMSLFQFGAMSKYIELRDIEIDGGTDNVDFWCLPAQAFWGNQSVERGGGLAIIVEGEYITIQGNYIHNCYQKAIEIRAARYLKAYDNIIHSIATTSLSGGHGIMRQQAGVEIPTNDLDIYRWDLMGNLIFNVEQRIYSWVPSKEMIEMVLDEGKPILIDDPKDNDCIQETMKARIKDNVVAYGSIDQIRLKSTPNLTVINNTVYSAAPHADGITDKRGDVSEAPGCNIVVPKFTNTHIINNAVQTMPGTAAFEMGDIILEGNATVPATINGNLASVGLILPNVAAVTSGISGISNHLFVDPDNGNFRLKTALGLPTTLGVAPATLDAIDARVAKFGVNVKWDKWNNDHLKLTQTILDNNPGVNDGINGNETVLTNAGIMTHNDSTIHFDMVPNSYWKNNICQCPTKSVEDFHLNHEYITWYKARKAATKNASGGDYTRIRWGNSILKQNQLFQNDWLTNSQIYKVDSNTVIYSDTNHFILNGDLLVDFEGYTPAIGNKWNLMIAKTITTANPGGRSINGQTLFDRVIFEGATLTDAQYTLTIVNLPNGQQALQLEIVDATLPVTFVNITAQKLNNTNVINWKVANQVDITNYEVQKSVDGINFSTIGTVAAANTNQYSFIDANPVKATNYYRIKSNEINGSFKLTSIAKVVYNNITISTYPNPAKDVITVSGLDKKGIIKVLSIEGKTKKNIIVNANTITLTVSDLKAGNYILQYQNGLTNQQKMFTKE